MSIIDGEPLFRMSLIRWLLEKFEKKEPETEQEKKDKEELIEFMKSKGFHFIGENKDAT